MGSWPRRRGLRLGRGSAGTDGASGPTTGRLSGIDGLSGTDEASCGTTGWPLGGRGSPVLSEASGRDGRSGRRTQASARVRGVRLRTGPALGPRRRWRPGRRGRVGIGRDRTRLVGGREPGQDEALTRHHPVPKVRQRVRLHRPIGRAADRELVERPWYELVDPGQGLLTGELVGEAALGDRAPHGAAQEHDDAVLHGHHDPERGDVLRHVADDPGGQPGRDHGGGRLASPRRRRRPGREARLAVWSARSAATAPRGIRTTVSPNRPIRPLPGSIPICGVVRSIALSLSEAATTRSALCRSRHSVPRSTHLGIASRQTQLRISRRGSGHPG